VVLVLNSEKPGRVVMGGRELLAFCHVVKTSGRDARERERERERERVREKERERESARA